MPRAFLDLSERATLRRVIEQREREWEAKVVFNDPSQFRPRSRCACGRRITMSILTERRDDGLCSYCRTGNKPPELAQAEASPA